MRLKIKRLRYALEGQIKLHPKCLIEPQAELIINIHSEREYVIEVGKGTVIKNYARICPRSGYIEIGEGCSINPFCVLLGYGGITIGNNVRIASNTTLTAFNHIFKNLEMKIKHQGNKCQGIIVEDDVWIGAGVRVLDGVTIGKGSVVGAGSVVTRDIPPYSVFAGVPARVIKDRKNGK